MFQACGRGARCGAHRVKIAFDERSTWTFFEQGGTVVATIEDKEFWRGIHNHSIKFGEGDQLRVRLHSKVEEKRGRLRQKNKVTNVYQVLDRPKQIRLDGQPEDEARGRKFRDSNE